MASRTIPVLPVPGEPNKSILSALPYSKLPSATFPLFTVIPAAKVEEWQEAYGGSTAEEQRRLEAEKAAAKKAAKKLINS
ncbi:hypothetical protein VE04_03413 [Pseudogymnoascus sp. 24MN13]|nr:hypothetical protein VE04_03413 [Pseudogymnoascus sp. 24MN13]